MDLTPWVYTVGSGGIGGLAYSYYNKLLTVATYLQTVYHVAAGALAAFLLVISGALNPPTDYQGFLVLAGVGYAGTDVIDSFIQRLQTGAASATGATPPPSAAP
jgi:hypothetical protein